MNSAKLLSINNIFTTGQIMRTRTNNYNDTLHEKLVIRTHKNIRLSYSELSLNMRWYLNIFYKSC